MDVYQEQLHASDDVQQQSARKWWKVITKERESERERAGERARGTGGFLLFRRRWDKYVIIQSVICNSSLHSILIRDKGSCLACFLATIFSRNAVHSSPVSQRKIDLESPKHEFVLISIGRYPRSLLGYVRFFFSVFPFLHTFVFVLMILSLSSQPARRRGGRGRKNGWKTRSITTTIQSEMRLRRNPGICITLRKVSCLFTAGGWLNLSKGDESRGREFVVKKKERKKKGKKEEAASGERERRLGCPCKVFIGVLLNLVFALRRFAHRSELSGIARDISSDASTNPRNVIKSTLKLCQM